MWNTLSLKFSNEIIVKPKYEPNPQRTFEKLNPTTQLKTFIRNNYSFQKREWGKKG